ncbi:MAG: 30S ribosomal protein S8 [Candidatus Gracilibacteria bacterium]
MLTNDPIADLLTRIRNATMARKEIVTIPHSKLKIAVLKVLIKKGFIKEFTEEKNGDFQEIKIVLNPEKGKFHLKKVSKLGQRIYISASRIKKVNGGLGVSVISTSKGVMSGEEAKRQKLGGEFICEIY